MPYYRFEARSTTPGEYRWITSALELSDAAAAAAQLVTDQAAVDAGKADIKTTRTILGVTGTLDMGLYLLVTYVQGVIEANKADILPITIFGVTGTFPIADYTPISGVVGAGNVVVGNDNYAGGEPGTYPTIAMSFAVQLAADQADVLAAAGSIKDDATILGQAGTYDFTAAIAAGYSSGYGAGYGDGEADQLSADTIAVNAAKGDVLDTRTILGVTGEFDLSAYTLKSGVVGPTFVLAGHDTYAGGSAGSLTLPAVADVWFGSGVYGVGGTGSTPSKRASSITNCVAGNIVSGVTIDDVVGTYGNPPTPAPWPAGGSFSFLNATPTAADLDSNFGRLLYRTCEAISNLGLFKSVLPFIKPQAQWQSPTCIVAPDADDEADATNLGLDVRYRFRIGFVVAGQDSSLLALQALGLRQAIKRHFRGLIAAKVRYTDVISHSDTNIVVSMPGPERELEGGPLFYNSGLTIEYLVREMRGQT